MTLDDITNNRAGLKCFWCESPLNHGDGKFVALCTADGVIEIKNNDGKSAPMVFCSSDCMVYDSYLRYQDRVTRGAFRKQFNQRYENAGQVPKRWADGTEVLARQ